MAQPVAMINGKKIYSDKNVSSIFNSKISFSDGSWCDVSTGEVVNNGPGFINIGASASGGKGEIKTKEEAFAATEIEVRDLPATDLDIQVHSENRIIVTKEGIESDISDISVRQNGNAVIVSGSSSQKSSGFRVSNVSVSGIRGAVNSIFSGAGNVLIRSGNFSISSGNKDNETKVTVKVPKGCPVTVSGIDGKTTIGDTKGSLRVHATLAGDVQVGHVVDATLNVQGSSNIIASRIDGNVFASIQGSGDIKIKQGAVTMLNASIQGSGEIRFGGKAQNANLSVMGSGDIDVVHVESRPSINIMGSGEVNVGNW